jgi:putative ABC transport system permease protein
MDIYQLVILSIEALKTNLVRTILTMLGVIIGIASVIIIVSLGEGATASIVGEISSFGANVLTVSAGKTTRGPGGGGSGTTVDTLVEDDVNAILKINNVENVSGIVSTSKKILYDGQTENTSIKGVEESYQEIKSLTLSQGSFISESQVNTKSKVLVLGDEIVEELFGEGSQVVGENVRVDGKSFRIIGVISESSEALVPLSTAQKILLSQNYFNSIEIVVTESELVETAMADVEDQLLLTHEIDNPNDADFSVRSSQEMISSISSVTGTLTTLLSGIAAISLVVGGIGIMNIMLVTVTERTKEIGLLKAIGAKRKDILTQFLIEAVVVTIVGGLIGISLGLIVTYLASIVLDIPFIISFAAVGLALFVSTIVGVVFGWYPASQASKLQPIDALRYE